MGKADIEYFSRRMREEREAADRTPPEAAAVHRQLADRYAEVVAAYEKASGGD